MKRIAMFFLLSAVLLVASQVLAISSTNYRLDWYVPLAGGASGSASSTNYAIDFTVGQSAIGTSASTSFDGCLGYWCTAFEQRIFLPLVLKHYA